MNKFLLVLLFLFAAKMQLNAAVGVWETSSWKEGFTPVEESRNLIRGRLPDVVEKVDSYVETVSEGINNRSDVGVVALTDGMADSDQKANANNTETSLLIGNKAILSCSFESLSAVEEVRIYATWQDAGRDKITVDSVALINSDDTTNIITSAAINYESADCFACAVLKVPSGGFFCDNAKGIVINFGSQENSAAGYAEIEVIGQASPVVFNVHDNEEKVLVAGEYPLDTVVKTGGGGLVIDSRNFRAESINLNGGTLDIRPNAFGLFANGTLDINVSGDAVLTSGKTDLMELRVASKSNDQTYATREDYSSVVYTNSIKDFISIKKLSGYAQKDVCVKGFFEVSEEDEGIWSFSGRYDDRILLKIDNNELFRTTSYTDQKNKEVALGKGVHSFEIRTWDNTGDWGYEGCIKAKKPGADSYLDFHEENFAFYVGFAKPLDVDLNIEGGKNLTILSSDYKVENLTFGDSSTLAVGSLAVVPVEGEISYSGEGDPALTVDVAEGGVFDISLSSAANIGKIVKKGAGSIIVGKEFPAGLVVNEGSLVLQPYIEYNLKSIELTEDVLIKFLVDGEIVDAEPHTLENGNIIFTRDESEYSGKGTWSEKNRWSSGEFPGASDHVRVAGEGSELTIDSPDLVMPASIRIEDGAALKVSAAVDLPEITLIGTAQLIIEADISYDPSKWVLIADGDKIPFITITKDATLSVPGGSKFGGMKLAVYGTLQTVGDGALTLGFSKIFEETVFGLVVDGGTIRVASGVLKFLCPDGRIVVPDNTITFKDAKMEAGSGNWLQPHFCDTLPIEQSILFDCDNTLIDFATGSYILRGSTRFKFKNGGGIIKSNTKVGNPAALWIVDNVKISMLDGASFIYGEAQAGSSVGGSALGFQPTEDGFESFSISDGEISWHRTGGNGSHGQYQGRNVGGNGKAKIRLNNVVFKTAHGTHSRGQIFDLFKEVELENGGLTIIAASNSKELAIDAPLTGQGGVYVHNEQKDLFKLTLRKENTATGPFNLGENVRVILTETSNWKGTFPWSDQVEIYKFQKEEPFDMTFGGLNLSKPLVYRIWKDGNDKINFVGEGIIPNGNEVQIQLKGGYNPPAGTSFDLGAVSDDFDIDSVINKNDKWNFEVVENDDGKHLKVSVREIDEAKLVFNGGSEGSVFDLNDTNGWAGGVVPSGQEVSIDGVALEISYDVPEFSSVTLKNGAKITVAKDISLPSLNLMSGTELIVKSGYVLTLSAVPSVSFEDSDSFSLPVIKIEKGGTLLLPTTSNFRGMKIDIQGTLQMLNKGDLVFGYADAGEVVPFGLSINGGSVILPEGNINFACPEEGGTVVAADGYPWNVVSATLTPGSAYGFNFGKGNDDTKEINVVFENTRLPYSATGVYYIQGALSVSLKNDSVLHKDMHSGYGESMLYVEDKSKLVFDNATLYWGSGAHDGSAGSGALYLNPIEDNWCSLDIKNSLFFYHHLTSNRKAVIKLDNAIYNCKDTIWNYLMPFHGKDVSKDGGAYNPAYVDLSGDVKFHLRTSNINMLVPQNVSFKGVGGIVLACPGEEYRVSTLAILNGENTASGAVIADNGCKVYFNDGANWAGTVVANGNAHVYNKYADNVYTHDSPASVTFGALDLQADFPVKVWKDENGKISGNDALNVGEYRNNGGRLVPELASEGVFVLGDKFVVGKISKSSPLPRVAKGWSASRKPIPEDADNDMLMLSNAVGFIMVIR